MLCQTCNETIPTKRLAAMPRATRCVVCQQRFDLSPEEALSTEVLAAGMAVCSELDEEMFRRPKTSW